MSDTEKKEKKTPMKPNQKKYSNFLITINPNISMDIGSPEFKILYNAFKKTLTNLYDKDSVKNIIQIKKDTDTFSKVKQIKSHFSIEIGKQNHLMHSHCLLEIRHYTCLKLNYDKIRSQVKEDLSDYIKDINNIHLDVKVIRSTNRSTVLDYVSKDALTEDDVKKLIIKNNK
jgi:hypothetical protein